jgi:uncharacterized protein (TIGR03083 family)
MAMQRDDPVQLIAQEQVRLFSELKKLSESAWRQPSRCEGWSNARVVAHLTVAAENLQHNVAKALRGDTLPPSVPGGQRLTPEQYIERVRSKQEELEQRPRMELLDLFDKNGTTLVDVLRRVAPHNMTKPAWSPFGERTIAMYVSIRIFELAFHGWDIHASLDSAARIREQLQPFLVHFFLQTGKRSFQGGPELDGVYRFELLGTLAWSTRVFNGKMDHGPLEPEPDATIKTDCNQFLLLSTHRASIAELEQQELLTIEGDHSRATQLLETLSRRS